ncbi:hypothetical protein LTR97_011139 [Elasticomyces elasticus]|uniref:Integral membrane protein n=1 Tax=Elasticomyces elasticus TaxID=574655 RepID=A0AAN7VXA3_9PEZI|nr:hypothetical protein LTR97_011139 [Elasticomyces elasticus]
MNRPVCRREDGSSADETHEDQKFLPTTARVAFQDRSTVSSEVDLREPHSPTRDLAEAGQDDDESKPAITQTIKHAARRLHLRSVQSSSVSRVFHPTTARMYVRIRDRISDHSDNDIGSQHSDSSDEVELLWRARDARKRRGSIAVPVRKPTDPPAPKRTSPSSDHLKSFAKNVARMFTVFAYWDMAFWCGWSYSIGSALFVLSGAFGWAPLAFPDSEFKGEAKYGVTLTFFFGALFYQIGAVVAYFEAVNAGSFHGSAMRRLLEGHEKEDKGLLDEKLHEFFHHMVPHHKPGGDDEEAARRNSMAVKSQQAPRRGGIDMGEPETGEASEYLTWRWWPTWQALRHYHAYEIGYLACTIQLFGVTLYGITSIVILPGILDSLNTWQTNAAYWIPQIVAAACFLVASIMFTLETQEKWWKPEPKVLGWWIGVWSTIGSVGFELCAGFGPAGANSSWCAYQSSLSSMWGSGAYLIGSMLQWYEAINKHPAQELLNEPGEMKTWQVHPI